MDKQLLRNAIRTPDGTVLESKHRHDYVSYVDKISGEKYVVEGGLEDISWGKLNKVKAESLCLYTDDPHTKIRKGFTWGHRGICGTRPLTFKVLKDLTSPHIAAILANCRLRDCISKVFMDELEFRKENK